MKKMYIDYTYIAYVLPAVLFAMWASSKVNSTFRKYSSQYSLRNMTGRDAARAVLDAHGLYNVRIERVAGNLTDHYDARSNVIRLSDSVYSQTSTAAIGVAAHEAGHAIQHAQGYVPIKLRNAIIPITNLGSKLAMPLILVGLLFAGTGSAMGELAYLGVACFGLSTLFQLLTLPTEFDASRRALRAIEGCNILTDTEIAGSRKVLTAAALTYVAALAVSLTQLLRLLTIVNRRNDRD
ncbi:zinc metallopeptidase [Lachnospiraceae bacterium AM25-11LB]|jgi:Zn-dependent membrane protease YugP|nr:zinc metallopeptidase [Lachnospiraceae bacterium AM25-22]RGD07189.1 zinc metallopeptidase [Lachnospiraceae bacterium AM25-11LB]RJW07772.1 zinc metallopeptidase [Lachnospiraceae bacterium AM25-40]RJW14832.1 zinc metallopeptidase [Lachnospiraceae bacterium AM25-39]